MSLISAGSILLDSIFKDTYGILLAFTLFCNIRVHSRKKGPWATKERIGGLLSINFP
jgi:hypothetical protein